MLKKNLFALFATAALAVSAHAVPIVVGTDFTAAPTNTTYTLPGSSTTYQNGENGNGGYLTIYGTGLGPFSSYGVGGAGTSHVYMVDAMNVSHEVASYQALATMPWNGAGMASGTFPNIQGLRVQVGNLGGAAYGTPLNIDVVVQGNHATYNKSTGSSPTLYYGLLLASDSSAPNKRTGLLADYTALTFTPVNGRVIYVNCSGNSNYTTGNDANTGEFAHPKLHLQDSGAFGGALPNSTTGNTDGTQPGTQAVMFGGGCPPVGQWDGAGATLNLGRWALMYTITGTAPGSGQYTGPVQVTSYPGGDGNNANEIAIYQGTTNAHSAGGFIGPDSPHAGVAHNPFDGTQGYGHYIEMSWLIVEANGSGPRDGAPWNLAYGSDYYRLSAVEGSWDAHAQSGTNAAKCAAVCGDGAHVRLFGNWFHDIYGSSADEVHGWYPDTSAVTGDLGSVDNTFAFNAVTAIGYDYGGGVFQYGGSGVSMNASGSDGTIQKLFIYNNYFRDAHKATITLHGAKSAYVFNNIMWRPAQSCINVSDGSAITAFQVFNNTCVDWDQSAGGRSAFWDQGGTASGADSRNNIVYRPSTTLGSSSGGWDSIDSSSTWAFGYGVWYDATGLITQAIPDSAGGVTTDPKFNLPGSGDFTLKAGSSALDNATGLVGNIPRDFDFMIRLQSGTAWDRGAYEKQ
jgi:hypothetical protein